MSLHQSQDDYQMDTSESHFMSPPGSKTPSRDGSSMDRLQHMASGNNAVDAVALNLALGNIHHTPRSVSPHRRRPRHLGDRFIPTRSTERIDNFSLLDDPATNSSRRKHVMEPQSQKQELANQTYADLLRAEMFDSPAPSRPSSSHPSRTNTPSKQSSTLPPMRTPPSQSRNLFSFMSNFGSGQSPGSKTSRSRALNLDPQSDTYSTSKLKPTSRRIISSPPKAVREISKVPFKVLDAPDLTDDFYLNLIDWGKTNILAVGLGCSVYLWNSTTGNVVRLCDLVDVMVTSVNWAEEGTVLAVGTAKREVQLWDVTTRTKARSYFDHEERVSSLAWNSYVMTSGGRDRCIYHRDVRQPGGPFLKLTGHKQEVCGLKWNTTDNQLASGGNDNKLLVWDRLGSEPLYQFNEHKAAVKALAWSPHQRGLLASGGGTADRTIKFWNTHVSSEQASHAAAVSAAAATCETLSGAYGLDIDFNSHGLAVGGLGAATASAHMLGTRSSRRSAQASGLISPPNLLGSYDTGSQVCNLGWSQTSNELVSTHGYSQNQIIVWRYPSMQQVASLTGHTYRVLYLAMSPDSSTIVTGAGDETLRFWNVFARPKNGGDELGPEISVPAEAGSSGLSGRMASRMANPFYDNTSVVTRWGTIR